MRRLGWVVGCLAAGCGRDPGPTAGETVAWVITASTVADEGCEEAATLVDATARVFAENTGFVYRVGDDGRSAEEQHCPLSDGAFELDACEGDGVLGELDGGALVFERTETVVEDGPCTFTLHDVRRIVDDGATGGLSAEVTATATAEETCGYTFEGERIRPDGCVVTVESTLELSDHAR